MKMKEDIRKRNKDPSYSDQELPQETLIQAKTPEK